MSRKSSPALKKYGSQEPTHFVPPKRVAYSDIDKAERLLHKGGIRLMTWQRDLLDSWLSRTKGNEWAASTCGLSVPRQNGKTVTVVGRCAWGMVAYGEWIIYTAHLQKTATETFEELQRFFETPSMAKYVKEIKTALGREEIKLTTGGRIKFLARTRNGGRGQHGDVLIFDEAQEVDDTAQSSFIPCLAASNNPQTIYLGTPPDETAAADVFTRLRKNALGKKSKATWAEWSVDSFTPETNADPEIWAMANPSLGYHIKLSTIEGELAQMKPDKFARERLGWWAPVQNADHPIPEAQWARCKTLDPPADGLLCYGVKFAPDNSVVSLSVALRPKEGPAYIEAIDFHSASAGTTWLVDWLTERKDKAAQIVIDGRGNSEALVDRLIESGVSKRMLVIPSKAQAANAYSTLLDLVRTVAVLHSGQPALTASATKTIRRAIGKDGGWGFETTEDGDATIIESAALALWAVKTTKRRPGRKATVL